MIRPSLFVACSKLFAQKITHRCLISYHSPVNSRNDIRGNKLFYRTLRTGVKKHDFPIAENPHKVLKIAIVGLPNAGKSTLINEIVGRNVFAVSSKVHTTRCRARAVMVVDNTQLIFLDTPGIVGIKESVKHHLERPCLVDSEEAIKEADLVGILHDVSNKYTIHKLDEKVLRHLFLYPRKPSFLILNKVDAMKSKRELLDCVKHLTKGYGMLEDIKDDEFSSVFRLDEFDRSQFTEMDLQNMLADQTGWPYFKKIFMISALNGDGVGDIQMYLMEEAKAGEWLFDKTVITDQNETDIIERTVFAKLLDYLPNVIPYNLQIELEFLDKSVDGSVTAIVLITAKKAQIKNLIKGKGGARIKKIAMAVEQNLRSFYLNDVHITLVLVDKESDGKKVDKASQH